jgi:hypothetical protein
MYNRLLHCKREKKHKNMRKGSLVVLIAFLMASCEKERGTCYTCKIYGSPRGSQYDRTEKVCVGSEAELLSKEFTDPFNNEMAFDCNP